MPTGTIAVLMALKAIHTRQYGNQAEYQQLVQFLVTQMPLDLRVAVLDGDELGVAAITTPVAQKEKESGSGSCSPRYRCRPGRPGHRGAAQHARLDPRLHQPAAALDRGHRWAGASPARPAGAAKAAMAAGQPPPEAAKPAPAAEVPAHTPAPPPPEIPPAATAAPATEAAPAPAAPLAGPGHVPMEAGVIPTSDPPPPMAGGEGFEVDVQPTRDQPRPAQPPQRRRRALTPTTRPRRPTRNPYDMDLSAYVEAPSYHVGPAPFLQLLVSRAARSCRSTIWCSGRMCSRWGRTACPACSRCSIRCRRGAGRERG